MSVVEKFIRRFAIGVSVKLKRPQQLWTSDKTQQLLEQIRNGSVRKIALGYELREPTKSLDTFTCVGSSVVIRVCNALINPKDFHQVTELDFSNNHLSNEAIAAIARLITSNPNIKKIRLRYCQISEENKLVLEDALKINLTLTRFDLRNNLFNCSTSSISTSAASTSTASESNSGASTPTSTTSSKSTESTGSLQDPSLGTIHGYLERNRSLEKASQSSSMKKIKIELKGEKEKAAETKTGKKEVKRRRRFYKKVRKGKSKKAHREWEKLSSEQSQLIALNPLFQNIQFNTSSERVMLYLLTVRAISGLLSSKNVDPVVKSNAALLKARREISNGKDEEAIKYADEAIRANPENAMAYLYRGLCHYRLARKKLSPSTYRKHGVRQGFFSRSRTSIQILDLISVDPAAIGDFSEAYKDFVKAYESRSLGKNCERFALAHLLVSGKRSGKSRLDTFTAKARAKEFRKIRRILRDDKRSEVTPPHKMNRLTKTRS